MKKLSKIALSVSLLGLGINVVTPLVHADSFDDYEKEVERKMKEHEKQFDAEMAEQLRQYRNEHNKIVYEIEKNAALSNLLRDEENKIWTERLGFNAPIKIGYVDVPSYVSGGTLYMNKEDERLVKEELAKRTPSIKENFEKNYPKFIEEAAPESTIETKEEESISKEVTSETTVSKETVSTETLSEEKTEKVEKVLPEKMTTPTESVDIKLPGLNEKEVISEEGRIIETQPVSEYSSGSAANRHHKHKHHFSTQNEQKNINKNNKSTSSNTAASSTTTQTKSVAQTVTTNTKSPVKTETKKVLPKTSAIQ